jgi:hypothetical protein
VSGSLPAFHNQIRVECSTRQRRTKRNIKTGERRGDEAAFQKGFCGTGFLRSLLQQVCQDVLKTIRRSMEPRRRFGVAAPFSDLPPARCGIGQVERPIRAEHVPQWTAGEIFAHSEWRLEPILRERERAISRRKISSIAY